MLFTVNIGKFLYLKDIELTFSPKLNVFTGETGVGKSLIIDAISFVLGKKGKYQEGDFVEIQFEDVDNSFAEEGTLILARQVKNGKNIYFINGKKATLSSVKEASQGIISIHGQGQQQTLFNKKMHLKLLDQYAGIQAVLQDYQKLYNRYRELVDRYNRINQEQSERLRELDILRYQLEELKGAELKKGEKERLEERYRYLSQIEEIKEAVSTASALLSEEEDSVLDKLSFVIKSLQKVSQHSKELQNTVSILEEAKALIQEGYYSLDTVDTEMEEEDINQIEERLNLINRLEMKYNTDEEGLLDLIKQFEERIEYLESLEFKLPQIQKEIDQLKPQIEKLADEISQKRKEAGERLQREVEAHLKELAMPEARFKVNIKEKPLDHTGKDDVEFLFSANKGFSVAPLEEVASGGEISRLSLALKLVVGSDVDCMIFDEIDTGIGGKTANIMAEKLKKLSEKYQVILITHLPQIAAVSDKHFYVEKLFTQDTTTATVKELSPEEKVKEIARMLSGKVDQHSIKLAQQMIG
ncbi:MAG: DNA repair protein RecN [Aquificae bacterium]|nr:DNA repair protein RecN [Aquificota bacterium]